jgi:hypothetical protein
MWAERDRAIGAEATIHRLEVDSVAHRAHVVHLEQRIRDQDVVLIELEAIRRQRDAMLRSPTWRIGVIAMSPIRLARRVVGRHR